MKIPAKLFRLSGFTMLLLACTAVEPPNVEPGEQSGDAELVFSSLEVDQTNLGTIRINGYDRHFSVTFPTSYDVGEPYPVVLFFHGCICRPAATDETVLKYDWSRIERISSSSRCPPFPRRNRSFRKRLKEAEPAVCGSGMKASSQSVTISCSFIRCSKDYSRRQISKLIRKTSLGSGIHQEQSF